MSKKKHPSKKAGKRTPSGRLSRSKAELAKRGKGVMAVALDQPHRRWLPAAKQSDQRAESVLGRLFLAGIITEAEVWAGERYARLLREFHIVLATPMTRVSAGFGSVADSTTSDDAERLRLRDRSLDAATEETDEEKRDRVLNAFNGALAALRGLGSYQGACKALDAVCGHDRGAESVSELRRGLAVLVELWRLDPDAAATAPSRARARVRGHRDERPEWPHDETTIVIVRE